MSEGDSKVMDVVEESREDGDSVDERHARNCAKLDAARERERQTIEASRERRQRRLEGLEWEYEVADLIAAELAAGRVSEAMSVKEAIAMFDAFDQTKH